MMAATAGKVMDSSFYIGRMDSSEEYKATVKTPEGPKEKVCSSWNDAVSWVNGIIDEEKRKHETDRDS